MVPIDIDVTPMENSRTHKKEVSRTYKNFDGYASIMAYIGTEGYGLNFELCKGSQHFQKDTSEFLKKSIATAKKMTGNTILVRIDSGNDAVENYVVMHWEDPKIKFLVKHNFRISVKAELYDSRYFFSHSVKCSKKCSETSL